LQTFAAFVTKQAEAELSALHEVVWEGSMAFTARRFGVSTAALASALVLAMPAYAQDAAGDTAAEEGNDDIVVTGVARGSNRLDTSVSVSSISADDIAAASPRSAAELFRNLPGIRSESTGGEGNANIQVRGLPVASGGAKFVQIHEDGLPVLEFGDITFGNADIFIRTDLTVARVESIRGGSASTFASNSPGGIINLIHQTGAQQGGAVQITAGLDFDEYRIDGALGARLSDSVYFHVGGFYREGEGPRDIGYTGNRGGQIRGSITQEFDGGYIRISGRYLNDRSTGYLPNPVRVTGTEDNPVYANVAGFDINNDSLHSRNFLTARSLNAQNARQDFDIREGMHPVVAAFGVEAEFELSDAITLTNRFRYADISGSFVSPFPGSVDLAPAVASGFGAGTQLRFANGDRAGQAVPGSTLIARVVLFNTRLNSLDNITNDLRLNGEFAMGGGTLNATVGLYKSTQDINTDWLWTSHLLEVRGGGDAALIDAFSATNVPLTDGGTVAYGASFFGNCCRRAYRLNYDTTAPFIALSFDTGALTIDGSLRFDFGNASGAVFGPDLGIPGAGPGVFAFDVNGNGTISNAETQTSRFNNARGLVDYDYDYTSYSLGLNYRVSDSVAVFARRSRGGRANADRITFNSNNINNTTGALLSTAVAIDYTTQTEVGVKYRSGGVQLFATVFRANTEEENYQATTQTTFSRSYRATGLELEGVIRMGNWSVTGGATYTDAEITRDAISPANVGNRPRRQANLIYQVTPQYSTERFTVGLNLVGTSESYAQDNEGLVLPAFTQINAFVTVRPIRNLSLSLNANNLFNAEGFTEAEEGNIPANGIVRARSITGRTVSASVRFEF
jgi:outer membrane receptor protein involved in Fe transport